MTEDDVYKILEQKDAKIDQLSEKLGASGAQLTVLSAEIAKLKAITDHILDIMEVYHEQEDSGNVGTPGGIEHMGDVWRLLSKWEKKLKTR